MKLTEAIRQEAQETKHMTVDEALALPNLLGISVSNGLKFNGFYTCTVSGIKTLFVRTEEAG